MTVRRRRIATWSSRMGGCRCASLTSSGTMLDNVVSPPKVTDNPSSEKQILKVFYKDNTFKSYNLPVDVQSVDVCSKFANKFLRISERAASHFSLHLVIQGKDVKQLQPTDRPLKIQKELSTLGYKFNTPENQNYFLFCLSEETKSKMNDYCERNSVMLGRTVEQTRNDQKSQDNSSGVSPQRGVMTRTQSVLTYFKPTKDNLLSAIKKKFTVSEKTPPNQDEHKGSTSRQRRKTAPTQILPQPSYPLTPQLTPQSPTTPQSTSSLPATLQTPTSQPTTPHFSTPQPYPTTPALSTPVEPTPQGELTISPELPRSLSQSWSPGPSSHRATLSPQIPPPHAFPLPPSPKLFSPPSSPYRGQVKTAEEDLETVINSIFGNNKVAEEEDDVVQMMDNLFDWYPATSAGSTPTAKQPPLSPRLTLSPRKALSSTKQVPQSHTPTVQSFDGEDDFNEILDALHQLSNV